MWYMALVIMPYLARTDKSMYITRLLYKEDIGAIQNKAEGYPLAEEAEDSLYSHPREED
jgi:hypothetical protein